MYMCVKIYIYIYKHMVAELLSCAQVPLAKRATNTVHPHMEEELVNEPTNWTQV